MSKIKSAFLLGLLQLAKAILAIALLIFPVIWYMQYVQNEVQSFCTKIEENTPLNIVYEDAIQSGYHIFETQSSDNTLNTTFFRRTIYDISCSVESKNYAIGTPLKNTDGKGFYMGGRTDKELNKSKKDFKHDPGSRDGLQL